MIASFDFCSFSLCLKSLFHFQFIYSDLMLRVLQYKSKSIHEIHNCHGLGIYQSLVWTNNIIDNGLMLYCLVVVIYLNTFDIPLLFKIINIPTLCKWKWLWYLLYLNTHSMMVTILYNYFEYYYHPAVLVVAS